MLKKIYLSIRVFFFYLFKGLKNADEIAFNAQNKHDNGDVGGIEQQQEVNNVYKDMLRGELTQEVKELRHEMYFAERESHKYVYSGNGTVKKKNNMFNFPGTLEMSDGNDIILIQENKEDAESLLAYNIDENTYEYMKERKWDYGTKTHRNFTIDIERDFIPKYAIEKYTTQLVLKKAQGENKGIIDLYTPLYVKQFDNVHKMFIKELEKIYDGDVRNDIIDFNTLSFTTYNAYGVDNALDFKFNNFVLDNIIKFEGFYVLRFVCDYVTNGYDILTEVYDEIAAEKNKNHEAREGVVFDMSIELMKEGQEEYDVVQAKELLKEFENE